jgi:hypothetical protein
VRSAPRSVVNGPVVRRSMEPSRTSLIAPPKCFTSSLQFERRCFTNFDSAGFEHHIGESVVFIVEKTNSEGDQWGPSLVRVSHIHCRLRQDKVQNKRWVPVYPSYQPPSTMHDSSTCQSGACSGYNQYKRALQAEGTGNCSCFVRAPGNGYFAAGRPRSTDMVRNATGLRKRRRR